MAIATTVAAEAAVAAAQLAAEVVRLSGLQQHCEEGERAFISIDKKTQAHQQAEVPGSGNQKENEMLEVAAIKTQALSHQEVKELLEISAIKIQKVFRGYLVSLYYLFYSYHIRENLLFLLLYWVEFSVQNYNLSRF